MGRRGDNRRRRGQGGGGPCSLAGRRKGVDRRPVTPWLADLERADVAAKHARVDYVGFGLLRAGFGTARPDETDVGRQSGGCRAGRTAEGRRRRAGDLVCEPKSTEMEGGERGRAGLGKGPRKTDGERERRRRDRWRCRGCLSAHCADGC